MDLALPLIVLGTLFLLGLAADQIETRTRLPRVTFLLGCGLLVGQTGFGLIPQQITALYDFLSVVALSMVAFLLGGSLTRDSMARHGRVILSVSLCIVVVTVIGVALCLWLAGVPAEAALLLGAIATATDPAATQDAIRQSGRENAFTQRLKGIVAIDDAWGMIVFGLTVVIARALAGDGFHPTILSEAAWELGGAILLGLLVGFPAAALTGRISPGEPLRAEALGIVFLTAGLSIQFDVSFLLAGMVAGAVIANTASHHDKAFHEIENFEWPFLLLFFILAGATVDGGSVVALGVVGLVFLLARIAARVLGGWLGGLLAQASPGTRRLYGLALLPQAGVAVGMALVGAQEFPEHRELILTVTIATTVLFEIAGPLLTYWAVRRAGD